MNPKNMRVPRFADPPGGKSELEFAGDVPPQGHVTLRVRLAWMLRHLATWLDGKPSCTLTLQTDPPLSKEELKSVVGKGLAVMSNLMRELATHNAQDQALQRYNEQSSSEEA